MTLESSKTLGGVGALLLVISGVGTFGNSFIGLLGLVGVILILIALKGMADFYSDSGIFNNALYAFIAGIIGAAAFIGTLVVALLNFVNNLPSWAQPYVKARDWQGLSKAFQTHITDFNSFWTTFGNVVTTLILAFVVLFVLVVIAMFFFRRSLGRLSTKTNVGLFATTGLLMLIGAILTIIIIGLLLIWIGWILLTVAFFSVKTTSPTQPAPNALQGPI